MELSRRFFLSGLACAVAAPAIVGSGSLMRLSGYRLMTGDRTFYVGSNGSDYNSGLSPVAPFRTIQRALDIAGDLNGHQLTVQLGSGRYSGQSIIPRGNSGDLTLSIDGEWAEFTDSHVISPNANAEVFSVSHNGYLNLSRTEISAAKLTKRPAFVARTGGQLFKL